MTDGWVRLHRKSINNKMYKYDPTAWRLFNHLLLIADWETGVWSGGRFQLADQLNEKSITTYKALKRLEKAKMVTLVSNNKYTDIYICNWSDYQTDSNNKSNNKVTTGEQQSNNKVTLYKEIRNKEIRNKNKYNSLLLEIIDLVNPKEKPTNSRNTLLEARLKEHTADEIKAAAVEFSKSAWHKANKQMTIDNLLAPSKFGRWHSAAQQTDNQSNSIIVEDE